MINDDSTTEINGTMNPFLQSGINKQKVFILLLISLQDYQQWREKAPSGTKQLVANKEIKCLCCFFIWFASSHQETFGFRQTHKFMTFQFIFTCSPSLAPPSPPPQERQWTWHWSHRRKPSNLPPTTSSGITSLRMGESTPRPRPPSTAA